MNTLVQVDGLVGGNRLLVNIAEVLWVEQVDDALDVKFDNADSVATRFTFATTENARLALVQLASRASALAQLAASRASADRY